MTALTTTSMPDEDPMRRPGRTLLTRLRVELARFVRRMTGRVMRRNQIKPGETYLTRAGHWLFEVECLLTDEAGVVSVHYTVVDTGQRCECTLAEFAGRVDRKLELEHVPARATPFRR